MKKVKCPKCHSDYVNLIDNHRTKKGEYKKLYRCIACENIFLTDDPVYKSLREVECPKCSYKGRLKGVFSGGTDIDFWESFSCPKCSQEFTIEFSVEVKYER